MAFFDQAFSGGGAPQMGGIGGLGGGGSPSAFTSPGMSPQALAMLMAMGRGAAPGGGPMGAGAAPQMGAPPNAMNNATPTPGVGMANQPPNNLQQIMQLLAALKGGGGGAGGLAGLLGGGAGGGGVAPGALGMMGLPQGTSVPQFTNSVMGAAGIPGY